MGMTNTCFFFGVLQDPCDASIKPWPLGVDQWATNIGAVPDGTKRWWDHRASLDRLIVRCPKLDEGEAKTFKTS